MEESRPLVTIPQATPWNRGLSTSLVFLIAVLRGFSAPATAPDKPYHLLMLGTAYLKAVQCPGCG